MTDQVGGSFATSAVLVVAGGTLLIGALAAILFFSGLKLSASPGREKYLMLLAILNAAIPFQWFYRNHWETLSSAHKLLFALSIVFQLLIVGGLIRTVFRHRQASRRLGQGLSA